HVAEIAFENEFVTETREVDHGTVTYLEKIEFLQPNLLAAHSVWVNDTEIGFLSKAGVKVSHCPATAMRMLGFSPVKEMLDAGIFVSPWMYLASLVNKGRETYLTGTTDPAALPAQTVLKMATINGAKSVSWDNEISSIEVSKKADMVIVDPFSWSMLPGQVFLLAKEASHELLNRAGITIPSRMNFIGFCTFLVR
ncbi:hypothetical protein MKX01_016745, partial [Papaver californicum]